MSIEELKEFLHQIGVPKEQRYFEDEAEAVSYFLFLLEGSSNTYRKYVL